MNVWDWDLPDSWQDVLRLDWLSEFAASRPKPALESAGDRLGGLPAVVDDYVAALRARATGGQNTEDFLEDCLFRLGNAVTELARGISSDDLPWLVVKISNRVVSRAMEISPLMDAAINMRSCPAAEISDLADAAAQNAATIRQLCA